MPGQIEICAAWFGYLSEVDLASRLFLAATVLLCAPIVLSSIHIVSYPYFCTNAHFVQYLFFKQALKGITTYLYLIALDFPTSDSKASGHRLFSVK